MEEFKDIIWWVFMVLFAIIGYFIKDLVKKVETNTTTNAFQEGQLKYMERVHKEELEAIKTIQSNKIDSLKEVTELQIGQLTRNMSELTESLNRHVEVTTKRMIQSDKTTEILLDFLRKEVESRQKQK